MMFTCHVIATGNVSFDNSNLFALSYTVFSFFNFCSPAREFMKYLQDHLYTLVQKYKI